MSDRRRPPQDVRQSIKLATLVREGKQAEAAELAATILAKQVVKS